ncbi:MAG: class I adenylate-forming enzyme family protein [Reyranellaceae bacterium]
MIVAQSVAQARNQHPTRTAIVFEGRSWNYRQLWSEGMRRYGVLKERGVKRHDRVGILIPNHPEWFFCYIAVSRLGAVAVPINPAYTKHEIQSLLDAADLAALIVEDASVGSMGGIAVPAGCSLLSIADFTSAPAVHEDDALGDLDDSQPETIFFSSGSTGQPKGIVHCGRTLGGIADVVRDTWQITQADVTLVAMPLAFVYASIVAWLSAVRCGASIVLQRRFDPQGTVELIAKGGITIVMGVRSMFHLLLEARPPADVKQGKLRLCLTSGDVLSPALDKAFFEAFGCHLYEIYGLTETPVTVTHTPVKDRKSREFSCGQPRPDVKIRLVDENGKEVPKGELGELQCQTALRFMEYFRNPEATNQVLKDDWFSTGDLMREDADGYLYFVERRKEMIKSSGFNILPGEVERIIQVMPGVKEVAVVGVPDERKGEQVKAFVVRDDGARLTGDEVIAECRDKLSKYKVPSVVEFIDALPRGATGKLMRKHLRAAG